MASSNSSQYRVCPIRGFRKLRWFWLRFIYVRVLLNWAWEPDWYDWQFNAVEHWGVCAEGKLAGGVRLYRPESLEKTLQCRTEVFCRMLETSMVEMLRSKTEHLLEITRLLVFGGFRHQRKGFYQVLRLLLRRVYTQALLYGRPLGLAVVNPFARRLLVQISADIAVIGETRLPSKNRLERKMYGEMVPHYTVLIMMLPVEEMLRRGGVWWLEEIRAMGKEEFAREQYPTQAMEEVKASVGALLVK